MPTKLQATCGIKTEADMTAKVRRILKRMSAFGMAAAASLGLLCGGSVMAETIRISVIADGEAYQAELNGNDAARHLAERLPLTLTFENFGAVERISYLKALLDLGSAPDRMTPKTGDLAYYAPWGNLAVFIGPFRLSPGLVPLGRLSPEALEAVKRSGSNPVRLEKAEP